MPVLKAPKPKRRLVSNEPEEASNSKGKGKSRTKGVKRNTCTVTHDDDEVTKVLCPECGKAENNETDDIHGLSRVGWDSCSYWVHHSCLTHSEQTNVDLSSKMARRLTT